MHFVVFGAVLTACSSGPARSSAAPAPRHVPRPVASRPSISKPRPTTTTAAPRPAPRRTVRPAPGFDDTTPAPAIHATGTDYVAIARSLGTYRYWLLAHHPDAALASQVYLRGTTSYQSLVYNLHYLDTRRQTLISIDQQLTFAIASIRDSMVTLRLHEVISEDRFLDRDHRVVGITPYAQPNDFVMVMTRDATGRWRLADVTQVSLDPTIVL